MMMGASDLADLKKAVDLDKQGWRYYKLLGEYYINHDQYEDALAVVQPFYHAHAENYVIGILYAKTLLLNKHYKECSDLLSKIDILPFEGATIGRELYHEAELMQAIEQIHAKNYTSALAFINDAKKWPLNLGVGKPYPENLDERLEDWMSYLCYEQLGKKEEAQESLQKVVQFKPKIENTVSNSLPANDLVTAWAMEKLDGRPKAAEWLNEQVKLYPGNKIIQWCKQTFEDKQPVKTEINDPGIRLVERLMLK
jgi:tetratricopeptide (TPR) repeat protein